MYVVVVTGNAKFKPYVTAVPDIVKIPLTEKEDFLILACDGLWDTVSDAEAAHIVYDSIISNPGRTFKTFFLQILTILCMKQHRK